MAVVVQSRDERGFREDQENGVPATEQAINAYYAITASSEFREVERLREELGVYDKNTTLLPVLLLVSCRYKF